MSTSVRSLEPAPLWNYFAGLNEIPRPSKKEEKAVAFIRAFGEKLGLPVETDSAGNTIIRKPGSPGHEQATPVILQSHLDMVHQKNSDTNFDFASQGIDMFIEDDWVKARGTTLGADNGIGVAAIMSVLAASDIAHPPLEALFTVDEETGMTGALALEAGRLQGKILLNLDTEEDNELTIGCAGGIDVTAGGSYTSTPAMGGKAWQLMIRGLTGGHSGVDIHRGRANANKLMNRLLLQLTDDLNIKLASVDGGSLRNAIPRESTAVLVAGDEQETALLEAVKRYEKQVQSEYHLTDAALQVTLTAINDPGEVWEPTFQNQFLRSVQSCPNGIYRMSPGIPGLVQSSNNIARILVSGGKWQVQCLTRSSVDSEKYDLARSIAAAFELAGGSISYSNSYPGWEPLPAAPIVTLMKSIYQERFGGEPHVNAVHAGLECGILGSHYPGMQMISLGPTILGAHSPEERVQISSVQKFWGYLLEILRRIP